MKMDVYNNPVDFPRYLKSIQRKDKVYGVCFIVITVSVNIKNYVFIFKNINYNDKISVIQKIRKILPIITFKYVQQVEKLILIKRSKCIIQFYQFYEKFI